MLCGLDLQFYSDCITVIELAQSNTNILYLICYHYTANVHQLGLCSWCSQVGIIYTVDELTMQLMFASWDNTANPPKLEQFIQQLGQSSWYSPFGTFRWCS